MLIGHDGRFITVEPTGNGIYAVRLIEALSLLDSHHQYRLYLAGPSPAVPSGLRENVEVRIMHLFHRSAWLRVPILFPWELWRRRVDIFHAHYTIPLWVKTPVVLTLHDFFWIVYPNHFVSFKRIPITRTVKNSVTRADRILVGTRFIQKETMEYFDVPEDRFSVIPYGLDTRFFARASEYQRTRVREKYGIDAPYILAVGDMHPRKNLARLIRAFSLLPERDHVKLVLVGKPLWKAEDLLEQIKRGGLEGLVITTGYVPDEDMPLLYQSAEVFCYPSLYEGFGFPLIEAMASGIPVTTSETSSCPEVGGEAALYFDPL
ncbi:MAG: glycosyltransferase [candidate division Zixibacteria bacterium]|nr:glycosyltransferase [candidate division Zixibacteria bacterium]